MRRRRSVGSTGTVVGGLILAAVLVGSGCSSESASTKDSERPTGGSVQSGDVAVTAVDNSFKAETVTVSAGTKVTWTNSGRNDHNIVPSNGGDYGAKTEAFKPGASYSATFSDPGTYHYYCSIHGTAQKGMIGTVEVVAP